MKFVCRACGFEYDEEYGYPDLDIQAGTEWLEISDEFTCPNCGVDKSEFDQVEEE